jgi:hypothetical protein
MIGASSNNNSRDPIRSLQQVPISEYDNQIYLISYNKVIRIK